jgi:hypothetical protein
MGNFLGSFVVNGNGSIANNLVVSGNAGIGTATPLAKLHISGGDLLIENSFPSASTNLSLQSNVAGIKGVTKHQIQTLGSDGTLLIAAGQSQDGSRNNIWLYNLSCAGGTCKVPSIILDADNTYVSGTLNVSGSKNFFITDPRYQDPTRKLVHSSLEGPEVGVYYRGEVKLDKGKAVVTLPEYFEALTRNENRTVLLTPKFTRDEEAICNVAASDVTGGTFTIRAFGVPDLSVCSHKVYWEVKAVRSDVEKLKVEQIIDTPPEPPKSIQ